MSFRNWLKSLRGETMKVPTRVRANQQRRFLVLEQLEDRLAPAFVSSVDSTETGPFMVGGGMGGDIDIIVTFSAGAEGGMGNIAFDNNSGAADLVLTLATGANGGAGTTVSLSGNASSLNAMGNTAGVIAANTITFKYVVRAGENSADLDYILPGASGSAQLTKTGAGGGLTNMTGGAAASLVLPDPGSGTAGPGNMGSLGTNEALVVDTPPIVVNVTSSLGNGAYTIGQTVPIQVTFSEPVTVTGGPPTLALNATGTPVNYSSGSGTSTLAFNYTVSAGNTSLDLNYVNTNSLVSGAGVIRDTDVTLNDATNTLPNQMGAGSLGTNKAIEIDTTAPTVTNVSALVANGTYGPGAVIPVTVTFLENVIVTGTPQLTLGTGGGGTIINYASGSGTNTLTFNYTVGATGSGQNSADLDYFSTAALALNGGTIKDAATNNATLTLPTLGGIGSLGNNKNIGIDTTSPTVTNVTSAKTDSSYNNATIIDITVTFSEIVNVNMGGSPTLTLETGTTDAVANYLSGSNSNTLTFRYTVAAGNTSADLDYVATTSLALNGDTIKDAAGNDAIRTLAAPGAAGSLGGNKAIVIDTTAPTATNVTSSVANGSYKDGKLVPITVTFNEAVVVTGTPQLTLETGTTDVGLNYASGSGTNTLTFNYTVAATHTSADLDYHVTTPLSLNGGAIKDAAGNNASLVLPAAGAAGSLGANKAIVIDTTAATVSALGVTSTSADATYSVGQTVDVTVNFSEVVVVTGMPQLTLETGTPDAVVNYSGGSGTSALVFTYTVAAGHTTSAAPSSKLDYTTTNALALNDGTIKDVAGNDATLTLATPATTMATGMAGSLSANKAIVIDGTAPIVSGVTSTVVNGSYTIGQVIPITVTFGDNVFVTGTPQLTLETGTTDAVVNYSGGSGTMILTFSYTVAAGNNSTDLTYTSTTALALNGGTIKDAAGNNATLTLAAPAAANSLGVNKDIVIDTTPPTVTNVTSTKADNSYYNGNIDITVTFSEIVKVVGSPTLTLETGTLDTVVNYASGHNSNTLTFTYTVAPGDTSADLDYVATTSLALNGDTIKDAAGNDAIRTLAAPGTAGSLGGNKALVIDTAVPTATNVTTSVADGSYMPGKLVPITVTFNEAVIVTGMPQLTLETGTTDTVLNYASGSGTNTLTFNYTVAATHTSADLDYHVTTPLSLNAGTIKDAADNNASLVLPAAGAAGSLGANKAIVIDTTAAIVSALGVTSTSADGAYSAGQTVNVTVNFSEVVIVTGTPQLTLETGATDAVVNYSGGSGTSALVFNYTVAAGHASADLDYTTTTALALNGGTIKDVAGNIAVLTLATPGSMNAGSLSNSKAIVIENTAPFVHASGVSSSLTDGSYTIGQVVPITVTFSENVVVTGTPQLTLETGTTDAAVNYSGGTGTAILTFNYTVAAGHNSPDLTYTAITALALNGGTIKDPAGNNAVLTLAAPAAAGSLGANKAFVIDTTPATISGVTTMTMAGSYTNGQVINITVTFNEPVTVTGVPQLTLETGATDAVVNYSSGSTTTALVFAYTVGVGHVTADLDYQSAFALALNSGTIKDAAGTNATLTLPNPGATNSLGANAAIVLDATTATVTGVTSTLANGSYLLGQVVPIIVTFSGVVNVTGSPQLTLETGAVDRTAAYTGGTGSAILTFNYTVAAGDLNTDLDYVSTTALGLNGGTINAPNSNAAVLTLPAPGAAASLGGSKNIIVDTIAPTVTAVNSSLANGSYTIGQVIPITVTFSEPVNVTGVPQLTLETGITDAVVNYTSGTGTNILTFNYTVAVGQTTTDLDYTLNTALALNGGTINDLPGITATLTLANPGAANSLGANKAINIDAILPTVTNVTSSATDGFHNVGAVIPIVVTFSESVIVTGVPRITLETGAIDAVVNYSSGTSTNTLTFNYTVALGQDSLDLDQASTLALALNGGTIKDAVGNNATLTLVAPAAAGSLGANKSLVIDTTAPIITAVTSSTTNGSYKIGQVIPITVTFSEVVNAVGTPQLTLETGTTDVVLNLTSGTGTNTLTFNYVVAAGQNSVDLDYLNTTALALNGATIRDASGKDATLTLAAPGAVGSLGQSKALVIDTTAASVTNVTSTTVNGTYTVGGVVAVTVTFTEPVVVTGAPQLTLETGVTDAVAVLASGSGTNTLIFNYTVVAGESSADLDYGTTGSLGLNGGTINDAATNVSTLTLAAPGAAGSLGFNKAIVIETVNDPPVNTVPSARTVNEDTNLVFSAANSNAISIADDSGSLPILVTLAVTQGTLTLASAGTAGFTGSGTNTLSFTGTALAFNTGISGLAYRGAAEFNGSDVLTMTTNDQGNSGTGGAKTDSDTVAITITAINDRPTLTATSPAQVTQNAGPQTVANWAAFTTGPTNESSQTLVQYQVSTISNASLFSIPPTVDNLGNLTYTPAVNKTGTSSFNVVVQDNGGTTGGGLDTSSVQTFTISVVLPSFAFIDTDGDKYTVVFQGGGNVAVVQDEQDGKGPIDTITVTGITSSTSSLSISVTKGINGNGYVNVGEINVTPSTGTFNLRADKANLTGAGITCAGQAGTITLHSISGGADINVTGNTGLMSVTTVKGTDPNGGTIGDGSDISSDGAVSLSAASFGNGTITAPSMNSLSVTGNFAGTILLAGAGAGTTTLGSATVGGNILASTWTITTGDTGTIAGKGTIGEASGAWNLLVPDGKVKSLILGDVTNAVVNVSQSIGAATLSSGVEAKRWLDGSITADSLGYLNIKGSGTTVSGDFLVPLTLLGTGTPAVTTVLGQVAIKGKINPASAVLWDITGNVGSVVVAGAIDNWTLGNNLNITTIKALNLGAVTSAQVNASQGIGSILAKSWADGSITAGSLGSLTTSGTAAFGADVTLSGNGVAVGKNTLGAVTIKSAATNVNFAVTGNAAAFAAYAFVGSNLTLTSSPTGTATLASFTTKTVAGVPFAFANSNVAADIIGTVSLSTVDTTTTCGFNAAVSLRSLRATTPRFTYVAADPSPQGIDSFQVSVG